jgi:hypothetical protein
MDRTNAERQRRYVARLKAAAAKASEPVSNGPKPDVRIDELVRQRVLEELPDYRRACDEAKAIIMAHDGFMSRADYKKIRNVLHPDTIRPYVTKVQDNAAIENLLRRYESAMATFTKLEHILVAKELPPPGRALPRTREELAAMKRRAAENRKAKRAATKATKSRRQLAR